MIHSFFLNSFLRFGAALAFLAIAVPALQAQGPGEAQIIRMLQQEQPYHSVSPELFEQLGWDLPDGGSRVKALADAAPGGAVDPRKLESLPADQLGYRAKWHEVRYQLYGLDWDIPGLHLIPNNPLPGIPTLVIINGGAANWYEFFLDPLNGPGLGQYLAQKIPVLLVTIPGNYRHGGWTETEYEKRIPGYLLDRDVSAEELKVRNAVYTFRVVTEGVKRLVEAVTSGPVVLVGHSTGGEIQFILKDSSLKDRTQGLSFGWGTGGPAALTSMREFRGIRSAEDYLDVWEIRPRPAEGYSRGYLGPLNLFGTQPNPEWQWHSVGWAWRNAAGRSSNNPCRIWSTIAPAIFVSMRHRRFSKPCKEIRLEPTRTRRLPTCFPPCALQSPATGR